MDEIDEKFKNFINLLKERTIYPIDNTDIKESCTATLLLLFAVVDSLSKITCSDSDYESFKKKRGNKDRFTGFLSEVMGNKYAVRSDDIYDLRNDIVHTGINTKVILYKSQDPEKHLEPFDKYLWINTNQFLDDLKNALDKIKKDIDEQGQFYQNAKDRLKNFSIIEVDEKHDIAIPSPGPDDSFYK